MPLWLQRPGSWATWEGCAEMLLLGLEGCRGVCWLAQGQGLAGGGLSLVSVAVSECEILP